MIGYNNVAIGRESTAIDDPMSEPLICDEHGSFREGHIDAETAKFQKLACPSSSGIDDIGDINGIFTTVDQVFCSNPLDFILIHVKRSDFRMEKKFRPMIFCISDIP